MGIRRFLRTFVDPEAVGDSIVEAVASAYRTGAKMHAGEDSHELLARVWIARMKANGSARGNRPEVLELMALSATQEFACLPRDDSIRALGLYFVRAERPDTWNASLRMRTEMESILRQLAEPAVKGQLAVIYEQRNPRMSWKFVGTGAPLS